jgi:lysophospholipase L1-like esterase
MIERLRTTLDEAIEQNRRYHWVIILGGIHDLGAGIPSEQIFHGLRQMYDMVYRHGADLVVLTINETGRLKTNDTRDADRQTLNRLIKAYAWENHWAGGRRTFCVDINSALPWHLDNLDEKKAIWDDHMHLTPQGYDRLATLIFQGIVDNLNFRDI